MEGDDERFGMLADDFDLASQQPSEDPVLSNDFGNSDGVMPKDSIPVTLALESHGIFWMGNKSACLGKTVFGRQFFQTNLL